MKHRNKISTFSYDQAKIVYCLSHSMAIFVTIVNIMRKIFLQNSFFKKNYLITWHIMGNWNLGYGHILIDNASC